VEIYSKRTREEAKGVVEVKVDEIKLNDFQSKNLPRRLPVCTGKYGFMCKVNGLIIPLNIRGFGPFTHHYSFPNPFLVNMGKDAPVVYLFLKSLTFPFGWPCKARVKCTRCIIL